MRKWGIVFISCLFLLHGPALGQYKTFRDQSEFPKESRPTYSFFPLQNKADEPAVSRPGHSRGKAVLLSMIIPGLGESYLGNSRSSLIFGLAEAGLWFSYLWGNHQVRHFREDYRNLAFQYAALDPEKSYPSYLWIALGRYDNVYENNERELIARNLKGILDPSLVFWDWESDDYRLKYRSLREKEQSWERVVSNAVFGMVINRIVSVINVIRLSNQMEKKHPTFSWQSRFGSYGDEQVLSIHLQVKF